MRETQSNTVFHNIIKMRELGILFVLIAMIFIFSVTSSVFFTVNNFLNITRQISLLGIMAMGMTMVIAVGGVDLSVGAVYAICSTSAAAYIGGASPVGGGGTIVGTLIGALIMGVLQNGLVLLGVNTFVQQIVIGMLVIVAVMIDVYRNEKRKSG